MFQNKEIVKEVKSKFKWNPLATEAITENLATLILPFHTSLKYRKNDGTLR